MFPGCLALKGLVGSARVIIHCGIWPPYYGVTEAQMTSGTERTVALLCTGTQHEHPIRADVERNCPRDSIGKTPNGGGSIFGMACPFVLLNICRTRFSASAGKNPPRCGRFVLQCKPELWCHGHV